MLICNTLSIHAFDQAFQAEFAIDNALHGYDLPYYFPDVGKLFAKSYNNTDFDTAFASAFTKFPVLRFLIAIFTVKVVSDLIVSKFLGLWNFDEGMLLVEAITPMGALCGEGEASIKSS